MKSSLILHGRLFLTKQQALENTPEKSATSCCDTIKMQKHRPLLGGVFAGQCPMLLRVSRVSRTQEKGWRKSTGLHLSARIRARRVIADIAVWRESSIPINPR
ncbi:MAG: hypothetical protein PHY16_01160 [Methylobacter sp.]|nr:hypothetical protein [Methylobacter sp.]